MKIAIITLPLHTNYGGILQAYALQTILQRMGHEVTLLEPKKRPLHKKVMLPLVWFKRAFRKFALGHDVRIFTNPWIVVRQNTDKFISKYIKIDYVSKWDSILANKYDAFVVGSDQIWRPCCCPDLSHAYLDFTKNSDVLRLSYAASLGTEEEEYTDEQIRLCKPLLHCFDIVTVRERSGINLLARYFDVNASQVLDPTMLLESKDYIKLFEQSGTPKSKGNLFVYILDPSDEKSKIISEIENEKGLKSFNVSAKVDEIYAPISDRIQPPLEEWIRGFYDSELVFTDSFHACVFSILFHKPFIVFGNKTRGMARFNSLLELFDLKERLILSYLDFKEKKKVMFSVKNYTFVDKILEEKRQEAFNILKEIKKRESR